MDQHTPHQNSGAGVTWSRFTKREMKAATDVDSNHNAVASNSDGDSDGEVLFPAPPCIRRNTGLLREQPTPVASFSSTVAQESPPDGRCTTSLSMDLNFSANGNTQIDFPVPYVLSATSASPSNTGGGMTMGTRPSYQAEQVAPDNAPGERMNPDASSGQASAQRGMSMAGVPCQRSGCPRPMAGPAGQPAPHNFYGWSDVRQRPMDLRWQESQASQRGNYPEGVPPPYGRPQSEALPPHMSGMTGPPQPGWGQGESMTSHHPYAGQSAAQFPRRRPPSSGRRSGGHQLSWNDGSSQSGFPHDESVPRERHWGVPRTPGQTCPHRRRCQSPPHGRCRQRPPRHLPHLHQPCQRFRRQQQMLNMQRFKQSQLQAQQQYEEYDQLQQQYALSHLQQPYQQLQMQQQQLSNMQQYELPQLQTPQQYENYGQLQQQYELSRLQQPYQLLQTQQQVFNGQQYQHPQLQHYQDYHQLQQQQQQQLLQQQQQQYNPYQWQQLLQQQQHREPLSQQHRLELEKEQMLQKLLQLQSQLQQQDRSNDEYQTQHPQKQPRNFQMTASLGHQSLYPSPRILHPKKGTRRQVHARSALEDDDAIVSSPSDALLSSPSPSNSSSLSSRRGQRFYLVTKPPRCTKRLINASEQSSVSKFASTSTRPSRNNFLSLLTRPSVNKFVNSSTQPSIKRFFSAAGQTSIMRFMSTQTSAEKVTHTAVVHAREDPSIRSSFESKVRTVRDSASSSLGQLRQSRSSCHAEGMYRPDRLRRRSFPLFNRLGLQRKSLAPQIHVSPLVHSNACRQDRRATMSDETLFPTGQPDLSPPVFIHRNNDSMMGQCKGFTITFATDPQGSSSQPAHLRTCLEFPPRQGSMEGASKGDRACGESLSPSSRAGAGARVQSGVSGPRRCRRKPPLARPGRPEGTGVFHGNTKRAGHRMNYRQLPEAPPSSSALVQIEDETKYQYAQRKAHIVSCEEKESTLKTYASVGGTHSDFASLSESQSETVLTTRGLRHDFGEIDGVFTCVKSHGMTRRRVQGRECLQAQLRGEKTKARIKMQEGSQDGGKPSKSRKRDKLQQQVLTAHDKGSSCDKLKNLMQKESALLSLNDSDEGDFSLITADHSHKSQGTSYERRDCTRRRLLRQERKRGDIFRVKPWRFHENHSSDVSSDVFRVGDAHNPRPSSSLETWETTSCTASETPRITSSAETSCRSCLERRMKSKRIENCARCAGISTLGYGRKHHHISRKQKPIQDDESTTTDLSQTHAQVKGSCCHLRNRRKGSDAPASLQRKFSSQMTSCEKASSCPAIQQAAASTQTRPEEMEANHVIEISAPSQSKGLETPGRDSGWKKTCGSQCSLSDNGHSGPPTPAGCGEKQRDAGPVVVEEVWSTGCQAGVESCEASTSSARLCAEAATATCTSVVVPEDLARWLHERHVTEDTARRLVEEGFDSVPVLAHLEEEDLRDMWLPKGQQRLLLHLVACLQRGESAQDLPLKCAGAETEDKDIISKEKKNLSHDIGTQAAEEPQPIVSAKTGDHLPRQESLFLANHITCRDTPLPDRTEYLLSSAQPSRENTSYRPQMERKLTQAAQIPVINVDCAEASPVELRHCSVDAMPKELNWRGRTSPVTEVRGPHFEYGRRTSSQAQAAQSSAFLKPPENDFRSGMFQKPPRKPVKRSQRTQNMRMADLSPKAPQNATDDCDNLVRVVYLGNRRVESTSKLIVSPENKPTWSLKDEHNSDIYSSHFHLHDRSVPHDHQTRLKSGNTVSFHQLCSSVESRNKVPFPRKRPFRIMVDDYKSDDSGEYDESVSMNTLPCENRSWKDSDNFAGINHRVKFPLRPTGKDIKWREKRLFSASTEKRAASNDNFFGKRNSREALVQFRKYSNNSLPVAQVKKSPYKSKGESAPSPKKYHQKLNDGSKCDCIHRSGNFPLPTDMSRTKHSKWNVGFSRQPNGVGKSPGRSPGKSKAKKRPLITRSPKPGDDDTPSASHWKSSLENLLHENYTKRCPSISDRCIRHMKSLKPRGEKMPCPQIRVFTANDECQRHCHECSGTCPSQEIFPHEKRAMSFDDKTKVKKFGKSGVSFKDAAFSSPKRRRITTSSDYDHSNEDDLSDNSQKGLPLQNYTSIPLCNSINKHQKFSYPKDATSLSAKTPPKLPRLLGQPYSQSLQRSLNQNSTVGLCSRPALTPHSSPLGSAQNRRQDCFMGPTRSWLMRSSPKGRQLSPLTQRSPCRLKGSPRCRCSCAGEQGVPSGASPRPWTSPRGKGQKDPGERSSQRAFDNKCQSSLQGAESSTTCKMDIMDIVTSPDDVDCLSGSSSSCKSEETAGETTENPIVKPPRMSQEKLARIYGRDFNNPSHTSSLASDARRKGAKSRGVRRVRMASTSFRKDDAASGSHLKSPVQRGDAFHGNHRTVPHRRRQSYSASSPMSKPIVDQGKFSFSTECSQKIPRPAAPAQMNQKYKPSGKQDPLNHQQKDRKRDLDDKVQHMAINWKQGRCRSNSANSGSNICLCCSQTVSTCCCCENSQSEWNYPCPFGHPGTAQQALPLHENSSFEVTADTVCTEVCASAPCCSKGASCGCGRRPEPPVYCLCPDICSADMQWKSVISPCCSEADDVIVADEYHTECCCPERASCPVTFDLRATSPYPTCSQWTGTSKEEQPTEPLQIGDEVPCATYIFSGCRDFCSPIQETFPCSNVCRRQEYQAQSSEGEDSLHKTKSRRLLKSATSSSKFSPEDACQCPANPVSPLEGKFKYKSCRCSRLKDETVATMLRKAGQKDEGKPKIGTPSTLTVNKPEASASWLRTPGEKVTFATAVSRIMLAKKSRTTLKSGTDTSKAKDESENNEASFQHALQQTEPALVLTLPGNLGLKATAFSEASFMAEMRRSSSPTAAVYISPPNVKAGPSLYKTKGLVIGDDVGSTSKRKYFIEVPRVIMSPKDITHASSSLGASPLNDVKKDWEGCREEFAIRNESISEDTNSKCERIDPDVCTPVQTLYRLYEGVCKNIVCISPEEQKMKDGKSSLKRATSRRVDGTSTDAMLECQVTNSSPGQEESSSCCRTPVTDRPAATGGKRWEKTARKPADRPRGSKGRRQGRSAPLTEGDVLHSGKRTFHKHTRKSHASSASESWTEIDDSSCGRISTGRRHRTGSGRKRLRLSDCSVASSKQTDSERSCLTKRSRRRSHNHNKHTERSSTSDGSLVERERRRTSRSITLRKDKSKGRASSSSDLHQGKRTHRTKVKARKRGTDDSSSLEDGHENKHFRPKGERHYGPIDDGTHTNINGKRKNRKQSFLTDSDSFSDEECNDGNNRAAMNRGGPRIGKGESSSALRIRNRSPNRVDKGKQREAVDCLHYAHPCADQEDTPRTKRHGVPVSESHRSPGLYCQEAEREDCIPGLEAVCRDRPCRPTDRRQDRKVGDRSLRVPRLRSTRNSPKDQQRDLPHHRSDDSHGTRSLTESGNESKHQIGRFEARSSRCRERIYETETGGCSTSKKNHNSTDYVKTNDDSSCGAKCISSQFYPVSKTGWKNSNYSGRGEKFSNRSQNPKEIRDELANTDTKMHGEQLKGSSQNNPKQRPTLKNGGISLQTSSKRNARETRSYSPSSGELTTCLKQHRPESKTCRRKSRYHSHEHALSGENMNISTDKTDGRRKTANKSYSRRGDNLKNTCTPEVPTCKRSVWSRREPSARSPFGSSPSMPDRNAKPFDGVSYCAVEISEQDAPVLSAEETALRKKSTVKKSLETFSEGISKDNDTSSSDSEEYAAGLIKRRLSLDYNTSASEDDRSRIHQMSEKADFNTSDSRDSTALMSRTASENEGNKEMPIVGYDRKHEDKPRRNRFRNIAKKVVEKRQPVPFYRAPGSDSGDQQLRNGEENLRRSSFGHFPPSHLVWQNAVDLVKAGICQKNDNIGFVGGKDTIGHSDFGNMTNKGNESRANRIKKRKPQVGDSTNIRKNSVNQKSTGEKSKEKSTGEKSKEKSTGEKSKENGNETRKVKESESKRESVKSDMEECSSSTSSESSVEHDFPENLPWSCYSGPPRLIALCRKHSWKDIPATSGNSENQRNLSPARDRPWLCPSCVARFSSVSEKVRPTCACPVHQSLEEAGLQQRRCAACQEQQQRQQEQQHQGPQIRSGYVSTHKYLDVYRIPVTYAGVNKKSSGRADDTPVFPNTRTAAECTCCRCCPCCKGKSLYRPSSRGRSLRQPVSPVRRDVKECHVCGLSETNSSPDRKIKAAGFSGQESADQPTAPGQQIISLDCPEAAGENRKSGVTLPMPTSFLRVHADGYTIECSSPATSPSCLPRGQRRHPSGPHSSSSSSASSFDKSEEEKRGPSCTYEPCGRRWKERDRLTQDPRSVEDICQRRLPRHARCSSVVEERTPILSLRRRRQPSLLSRDQAQRLPYRDQDLIDLYSSRGGQREPCPTHFHGNSSETKSEAREFSHVPTNEALQSCPHSGRYYSRSSLGRPGFFPRDVSDLDHPDWKFTADGTEDQADQRKCPRMRSLSPKIDEPTRAEPHSYHRHASIETEDPGMTQNQICVPTESGRNRGSFRLPALEKFTLTNSDGCSGIHCSNTDPLKCQGRRVSFSPRSSCFGSYVDIPVQTDDLVKATKCLEALASCVPDSMPTNTSKPQAQSLCNCSRCKRLQDDRPVRLSIINIDGSYMNKVIERRRAPSPPRRVSHETQGDPFYRNTKSPDRSRESSIQHEVHHYSGKSKRGSFEKRLESWRSKFHTNHNASSNVQVCPTSRALPVPTSSESGNCQALCLENPDNLASSMEEKKLSELNRELSVYRDHSCHADSTSEGEVTPECASQTGDITKCEQSQESCHKAEETCHRLPSLVPLVQETHSPSQISSSLKPLFLSGKESQNIVVSRDTETQSCSGTSKSTLVQKKSSFPSISKSRPLHSKSFFMQARRKRLQIDTPLIKQSPLVPVPDHALPIDSVSTDNPANRLSLRKLSGMGGVRSSCNAKSSKWECTDHSASDSSGTQLHSHSSSTTSHSLNNTLDTPTAKTHGGRETLIIASERRPDPLNLLRTSRCLIGRTPCDEGSWRPVTSPQKPATPFPPGQPTRRTSWTAESMGTVVLSGQAAKKGTDDKGKGPLRFPNAGNSIDGLCLGSESCNSSASRQSQVCSSSLLPAQDVGATSDTKDVNVRLEASRHWSPGERSPCSLSKEWLHRSTGSPRGAVIPSPLASCSSEKTRTFSGLPFIRSKETKCGLASQSIRDEAKEKAFEVAPSMPGDLESSADRLPPQRSTVTFPQLAVPRVTVPKSRTTRPDQSSEARRAWKVDDSALSRTVSPLSLLPEKRGGQGRTVSSGQEERRGRQAAEGQCGHSCEGGERDCTFCTIYNSTRGRTGE